MEAYRSVIMEAFRDWFASAELISYKSYKEVLFVEATEEWYAQRDPDEVDWVECDCIRHAEQFAHGRVQRTVPYLCAPSINEKLGNTFRELPPTLTPCTTAG